MPAPRHAFRARANFRATDDECPTSEHLRDLHVQHRPRVSSQRPASHALRCAPARHGTRSARGEVASRGPRLARERPRVGGRGRWRRSFRPEGSSSVAVARFPPDAPATSPNAPPPVTHLLTAYDMSAAPAMQVTPLRLAGTGAERPGELGSRLWRAIRLARDVRREGVGSAPAALRARAAFPGRGRRAPALGARGAVTDAVEASLRTENAAFALAEEPTRWTRRCSAPSPRLAPRTPRFCARRSTRTRRRRPPRAGSRFPGPATTACGSSRRRIVITKLPPRSTRRSIWRTAARAAREFGS